MRAVVAVAALTLTGCGEVLEKTPDAPPADVPIDQQGGLGSFGTPRVLSEVSSSSSEDDPTLTGDLLEIFFDSTRPGASGGGDIWVAGRLSVIDRFAAPTLVAELDSPADDTTPEIAADGLTMYFSSDRLVPGDRDIYMTTRPSRSAAWIAPVRVAELSSGSTDDAPVFANGGLTIYFASSRAGTDDLYRATRVALNQPFGLPAAVKGLSDPAIDENQHWVSDDELTLYVSESISPGGGISYVTRPSTAVAFGPAAEAPGINTASSELDPWLSPDQRTIVFTSNRGGNEDLYIADR